MPGMKKMPQDKKNYKSKAAMKDGQDTLNTMQPRKGGIYMDREDGKLPADRVAKYYQETNPKMEQVTGKQMMNDLKAAGNFIAGGGPLKDMKKSAESAYKSYIKPTVDKAVDVKNKTFGSNFFEDNVVNPVKSDLKALYNKLTG